jgi:hypothetical protein
MTSHVYFTENTYKSSSKEPVLLSELSRAYCGIFAPSKNYSYEAREAAVASKRLWNNIRFHATAAKQTTEQRSLLGSRFFISDKWTATEERCFLYCPCRDVITGTVWGNQLVARVLSWKSDCEENTRWLVWNSRQPVSWKSVTLWREGS